MPITQSLYRTFKGLDARYRPLQIILIMWLAFGVLTILDEDFDSSLVPWVVAPIQIPVLLLIGVVLVDLLMKAWHFLSDRFGR
jgi:hypothetical protein